MCSNTARTDTRSLQMPSTATLVPCYAGSRVTSHEELKSQRCYTADVTPELVALVPQIETSPADQSSIVGASMGS